MKISGFAKVRNEVLREGNVHRMLANLALMCDGGILCDDASTDGTREVLEQWVSARPSWFLLKVEPAQQAFEVELQVKQGMLDYLHSQVDHPDWILWLDGDEVVDDAPRLRAWLEGGAADGAPGVRMHYTQLWRNTSWARTDDGFDGGSYVKLWRYSPTLSFETKPGTHHQQFPRQISYAACPEAPVELMHLGNVGKNLVWKAIQYANGLGSVDRHIHFGHPASTSLASGRLWDVHFPGAEHPTYRRVRGFENVVPGVTESRALFDDHKPQPFTLGEIRRIRAMGNLRAARRWFSVVVPAYNRAPTLPKALDSLLAQTYGEWIALVLDDGSTDGTPAVMRDYQDRDPRIFYARYETNRGGVAMNEIGMRLALEFTEWWTRLGSDDWFGSRKLERDAAALVHHGAVYGPYTTVRDGDFAEICNGPLSPQEIRERLSAGRFVVSWANIAVRCSVLREVGREYGHFADPRLRNCEDFLVNKRIAEIADFVWRDNGGELDAIWTAARSGGASSPDNERILAADEQLTRQIIAGAA